MGVLVGLWMSVRNSERIGIDGDKAWNLGILVVLCGIVGAKVLYVVNEWSYYTAHPSEIFSIATLQAGGVFSGGLIAAFVAAAWYVRKHHLPPLGTCDAFAPGLALGHSIGRIGCFAAGCCYGKETHHWWGVTFTNKLANEITGTPLNKPLEPTQLFESAVELANFFILMWLLKRRKFDGQIFGAFMFIYGVARFQLCTSLTQPQASGGRPENSPAFPTPGRLCPFPNRVPEGRLKRLCHHPSRSRSKPPLKMRAGASTSSLLRSSTSAGLACSSLSPNSRS
jgi:phosphatidylglycerol:prolipoprotein diacylglycerol transferase